MDNLVSTEDFVNSCKQIFEISDIRHGVMIVGQAGSGKSSILKTVVKAIRKKG